MDTMENSLKIIKENSPCKENSENVVVILDVRNITCRQCTDYSNTRIDYSKLLADTIGNRQCIAAIAVDGVICDENGNDKSRIFHNELKKSGFRIELVPATNNKGKQEGVDVKIALLAQKYALLEKCNVIELITGDGDFTVLVKDLHAECVRVDIISFSANLSYSLKAEADSTRILDDMTLIKMEAKQVMEEC